MVLEEAQQLDLEQQRQLAHLVEEDDPAVGQLEPAARAACAPVNAPFSWPKSSLSSRFSGIAPQLMFTNGLVARLLRRRISFATSSLPVPLSPRISTEMSTGADLLDVPEERAHRVALARSATEPALLAQRLQEHRRSAARAARG